MPRMASKWKGTKEETLWEASSNGNLEKVTFFVCVVNTRCCHVQLTVLGVTQIKAMVKEGAKPNVAKPPVNVVWETCACVAVRYQRTPLSNPGHQP